MQKYQFNENAANNASLSKLPGKYDLTRPQYLFHKKLVKCFFFVESKTNYKSI